MTDIVIDIRNVASSVSPDDRVYVWAPHLRERTGGGLTSTAPEEIPLADGQAIIKGVDPGPVMIRFECMGISDTSDKMGVVPDDGPIDLLDVLSDSLDYPAPVVGAAQQARNDAWRAAEKSGEAAVDSIQARSDARQAERESARHLTQAADVAASIDAAFTDSIPPYLQPSQLKREFASASSASAPLAPLFLDPVPLGVQSGGPVNLRDGLSPQHGPGGGWVEEMSVTVVGDAGATTLVSPDTATVEGFVTQRWQAAVSTGDRDFFVEVVGTSSGGVIHLRDPLPVSVDGHLSARYDTAPSGQHLTRRGTRAYVESLLGISPVIAARGPILDGAWTDQPTRVQDLWRKNSALDAAGVYEVTEGGRVVVGVMSTTTRNSYDPDFRTPFSLGTQSHVSVGVGAEGQGLVADFDPAGRATVLEFAVGCQRISHAPEDFMVRIVVTADGVPILDVQDSGALRVYQIPITGVDHVTVGVTSASAIPHNIFVSETTMRVSGQDSPPQGRGKIVCLGDSWMAWYDGEFGKALAEKTGAQVVNRSLGGMTTEWGLAWWDEYVTKERPDEVWIHFFTNDLNSLHTQTFVAPDGTTRPMWLTSDYVESRALWRRNLWEMIRRAQAAGIRPVVIMPSGTVGPNQTQSHMSAGCLLETPPLDATYQASAAEVDDVEWVGNRRHKYTGKPLQLGASTVWATGPAPTDPWENPVAAALMSLQRVALKRTTYVTDATNFRHLSYGVVSPSDAVTFTMDSGRPTLDVSWGSDGGGGHRIAGDVSVVSGREYLTVVRVHFNPLIANSNLSGVSGSNQTVPWAGAEVGMPAGEALLIKRETGGSTPVATIQLGHGRSTTIPTTMQTSLTVEDMAVIDIAALLRDVPNLAEATDRELAFFALSLTD